MISPTGCKKTENCKSGGGHKWTRVLAGLECKVSLHEQNPEGRHLTVSSREYPFYSRHRSILTHFLHTKIVLNSLNTFSKSKSS